MKRSSWIAVFMATSTAAWLASGQLGGLGGPGPQAGEAATPAAHPMRVAVTRFRAVPVERELVLHGQTQARRAVLLKSETAGTVAAVPARRGEPVRAGDVLIRLSDDDRRERLEQARALERQRELEFEGARSLKSQNLNAERQVAEARALLDAARAERRAAELHLERAALRAPFDGVLEQRPVEVGDYLGVGDPAVQVVELDPLRARGDVPEREVEGIRPGLTGRVRLADGRTFSATVTYLASSADASTRTFPLEMELANPGGAIPAGMTAELIIPTGQAMGHRLSSALLALNDAGELGVKRVDAAGVVHFEPVVFIRSNADALWVGGLPEEVRLITAGQGFVRDGDRVEAVEE